MPRTARSRSALPETTAALLPPSSSRRAAEPLGDRGADEAAHPGRAGGAEQRDAGVVDERLADLGAAEQHLGERLRCAAARRSPGRAPRGRPATVSGVGSEGFQTTGSPQTRATAVFHDQTAAGKLKAEITPTTPSGCQVSISRWPGRSEGIVPAVELARQPDREVADVDHLLDLAARLGGDLPGLDADQDRQVVLVLGQQLAEPLDQRTAGRRRHPAPGQERLVRPADRLVDVRRVPPGPATSTCWPLIGERVARRRPARRRRLRTGGPCRGPARTARCRGAVGWGIVVMVRLSAPSGRSRRC